MSWCRTLGGGGGSSARPSCPPVSDVPGLRGPELSWHLQPRCQECDRKERAGSCLPPANPPLCHGSHPESTQRARP